MFPARYSMRDCSMRFWQYASILLSLVASQFAGLPARGEGPAQYVFHISVDGLGGGYLESMEAAGRVPNFARLRREGAWTHNARTDFDFTITLPNHTSMVTGRPVLDKVAQPSAIAGHLWVANGEPGEATIHEHRHDYVSSTFDVAHDNGLHTALFPSKTKFILYNQSYDERHGAPDRTGPNNGRRKIDLFHCDKESAELIDTVVAEMRARPFEYLFVHIHDCDSAGHEIGWGSPEYQNAVVAADGYLGKILALVDSDPRLRGKAAIVLSADHGGWGKSHGNKAAPIVFTIPFYVWGPSVAAGRELYELNSTTRHDPGHDRPDYTGVSLPPIRNGDGGNLALQLLGLGPIPGSTINAAQDLMVR